MDWSDLSYVLALGRHGTMSAAAAALQVNHTTVSRRIHALQAELGRPLFVNTHAGWSMTALGEAVFARAERMEVEVLDLERELLGGEDQLGGTLRITSLDMFFKLFAREFVAFSELHPKIDLELSSSIQAVNLTRREADVALRFTNAPPEHLVGRRVGTMRYAAYASQELCERHSLPPEGVVDLDALSALPWVGWEERVGARMSDRWMANHIPDAHVAARFDNPVAKAEFMAHGGGAGLMSGFVMRRYPNMRRLTNKIEGFDIDIWLLTHPDLRRSARVKAFMEFFADALKAYAQDMEQC